MRLPNPTTTRNIKPPDKGSDERRKRCSPGCSLDLSPPTGPALTTGVVFPALEPQRSSSKPPHLSMLVVVLMPFRRHWLSAVARWRIYEGGHAVLPSISYQTWSQYGHAMALNFTTREVVADH
ncbi:unnamed protein product [Arctogadus glacialis]